MSSQRSPTSQGSQSQSSQDKNISSSSSSGTSHSTSHSIASISSGMDTCPITQEMTDTLPIGSDDEAEISGAWGRLFPIKSPPFMKLYLLDDIYSFGRETETCDVSLSTGVHQATNFFKAYSKVHFRIERRDTSTGIHVFLIDCSSNGTFINGIKVGKDNTQVLKQFDEIALAHRLNKAYIYQDLTEDEEKGIPKEITDNYLLTKKLGEGAYGEVRLAFEKGCSNPGKVAVKIISNKKLTMGGKNMCDGTSDIMREVSIMKQVNHPCIVKVLNVYESELKTYILLELVEGGELFDRVQKNGCFSEPIAKLLFYQMLVAVEYLHKQGITHRDLKPENILLSSADSDESLIKVADFGVSKIVDSSTMMKTLCGTPNYLAPEVLQTKTMGQYDNKVDCWSLGVILFICLGGYPPFTSDRKDMPLVDQIKTGSILFERDYWKDISKPAVALIKRLLTVDPKKRPTVIEALEDPWLDDADMRAKADRLMWPKGKFAAPMAVRKRHREGGDSATEAPSSKALHRTPDSPRKGSPEKPSSPKKPISPVKKMNSEVDHKIG